MIVHCSGKLLLSALIAILIVTSACGNNCEYYPQYDWGFNYDFDPYLISPEGILVDPSGQTVDLVKIDRLTREAIDCIDAVFYTLTRAEKKAALCPNTEYRKLSQSCVNLKIPNDWVWSCDRKEQLLKDVAPQEGCTAKGFDVDLGCPCRWRAGVQKNNIIISTPNLKLYKDPLVKIQTGCQNPWNSKTLTKCMAN